MDTAHSPQPAQATSSAKQQMVFISYSHQPPENADFVRELATRLRAANFDVWLDEEQISIADRIQEKIADAISRADAALFIVTSRWLQKDRDFIQFEVSLVGDQRAARRVVVLREAAGTKELGPYFCTLNQLEWFPDDPQPDARFWEIYCGITGTAPGPRSAWEERGRALTASLPVPQPSHVFAAPVAPTVVAPPVAASPKVRPPVKSLRVALLYKRNAHPDDHVLALLENGLRAAGHDVFIDRHLHIGVEWATEIERQVREADAVIPILSAAAVQSEMLEGEVKIAWEAAGQKIGRPRILPVRVNFESALGEPFLSILGRLQYALWRTPGDDEQVLNQVLDSLEDKKPQPQLPAVPEAQDNSPESPYYIVRAADQEFYAALQRQDSIVLLKGARQMGKTSLLARGLRQARKGGARVATLDYQKFNREDLADITSFYKALGAMIADKLRLDRYPDEVWRPRRGASVNFEGYVLDEVLAKTEGHLIFAMDEVDRLFTCPWASEVFGLFRTWYNDRSLNPDGPWTRLTLAIVYATEAHLFITDQNQSPFNVGTKLELQDFNPEQVEQLNHLYQDPLRSPEELKRFFALFNGQPYLTRRAFSEMTAHGLTLEQLEAGATDEGPFGDHLRRILVMLAPDPTLLAAVRGMVQGKPVPDQASFYRLRSGGLVTGTSPQDARFRCGIYATYLARHLS